MMKAERGWIVSLGLAFFLGLGLGYYTQETALSSLTTVYSIQARDEKTADQIEIQVQRYDTDTFKIQSSDGRVTHGKMEEAKESGAVTFGVETDQGNLLYKLTLSASLLPWEEPKLTLFGSERYQQIGEETRVGQGLQLTADSLKANTLTNRSLADANRIKSNVSLTLSQVNQVISDFGVWLAKSSYGQGAVLVREAYDASYDPQTPDIATIEVVGQTIMTRVGDLSSLGEARQLKVPTSLGLNLEGTSLEEVDGQATFRLYHLKSGQEGYFTSPEEERTALSISDYDVFYANKVSVNHESLQIILASNGRVYYGQDYRTSSQGRAYQTYAEAPSDMQEAYTDLLGSVAGKQ